jgi:hypothetical protein
MLPLRSSAASAIARATPSALSTSANPTKITPSGDDAIQRRLISIASRVFPVPLTPASVTARSTSNRLRISLTVCSRRAVPASPQDRPATAASNPQYP